MTRVGVGLSCRLREVHTAAAVPDQGGLQPRGLHAAAAHLRHLALPQVWLRAACTLAAHEWFLVASLQAPH